MEEARAGVPCTAPNNAAFANCRGGHYFCQRCGPSSTKPNPAGGGGPRASRPRRTDRVLDRRAHPESTAARLGAETVPCSSSCRAAAPRGESFPPRPATPISMTIAGAPSRQSSPPTRHGLARKPLTGSSLLRAATSTTLERNLWLSQRLPTSTASGSESQTRSRTATRLRSASTKLTFLQR